MLFFYRQVFPFDSIHEGVFCALCGKLGPYIDRPARKGEVLDSELAREPMSKSQMRRLARKAYGDGWTIKYEAEKLHESFVAVVGPTLVSFEVEGGPSDVRSTCMCPACADEKKRS